MTSIILAGPGEPGSEASKLRFTEYLVPVSVVPWDRLHYYCLAILSFVSAFHSDCFIE